LGSETPDAIGGINVMELLAMGEYGPFVWSSYFLTLVVVIVSAVQARHRHRQIANGIRQRLKAEETTE
jgi:heme exporter protein CcmD